MLRVESLEGNTEYSLKCGGAHLGGEVGSVSLRSALHKKSIIDLVTVVSEFIF